MTREFAITVCSLIAGVLGIYMMLTPHRGPRPKRRFFVGVACLLGAGAISIYQFTRL